MNWHQRDAENAHVHDQFAQHVVLEAQQLGQPLGHPAAHDLHIYFFYPHRCFKTFVEFAALLEFFSQSFVGVSIIRAELVLDVAGAEAHGFVRGGGVTRRTLRGG